MDYKTILLTGLSFLLLLITTSPLSSMINDPEPPIDIESLETRVDFEQAYEILKDRIDQLKSDKNNAVTKSEKELIKLLISDTKSDIKAIKAKAISGGIYIGSGALVVLLVLLLLL